MAENQNTNIISLIADKVAATNPYQPGTEAELAYVNGVQAMAAEMEQLIKMLARLDAIKPPSAPVNQTSPIIDLAPAPADEVRWV